MRLRSEVSRGRYIQGQNGNNNANDALIGNGDSAHHNEDDSGDSVGHSTSDSLTNVSTELGQGDAGDMEPAASLSCLGSVVVLLKRLIRLLCYLVLFVLILVGFVAPGVLKVMPHLAKHLVYLNAFKIPYHVNLSDPASVELNYARNFYLETDENITVGVWHILPKSLEQEALSPEDFVRLLSNGAPIMIYCHGNTGTRAIAHRVDLYKRLANEEYHIIALDYRGYGDSTGSPTSEHGVMRDVVHLYHWVEKAAGGKIPIYVWGHSLGTGIATKAVRHLIEDYKIFPAGLVLESPFNNIYEAAINHPFARPFKIFWWVDDFFLQAIHDMGIHLENDENILHIDLPILILHSEDDIVVPFYLGEKLYEASKKRPDGFHPVTFHRFDKERGYTHKWICTAPELPRIIETFINSKGQKSIGKGKS